MAALGEHIGAGLGTLGVAAFSAYALYTGHPWLAGISFLLGLVACWSAGGSA